MRRAIAAVIAAALLVALTACGGPDHGIVHDKSHSDAYTSFLTICSKTCTIIPQYHGPTWSLDVYNGDEHGWVSVTEQTYNAYEVGDSIDFRKEQQ